MCCEGLAGLDTDSNYLCGLGVGHLPGSLFLAGRPPNDRPPLVLGCGKEAGGAAPGDLSLDASYLCLFKLGRGRGREPRSTCLHLVLGTGHGPLLFAYLLLSQATGVDIAPLGDRMDPDSPQSPHLRWQTSWPFSCSHYSSSCNKCFISEPHGVSFTALGAAGAPRPLSQQ